MNDTGAAAGTDDGLAAADAMRLSLELECPSDVRYIERIVDLVARHCSDFAYPRQLCSLNVRVALAEALSNAILRGNGEDASKHVTVRMRLDAERLVLEIQDQGDGFDIDAYQPDPDGAEWLEREDGRGLFLMRRLMTHVERVPNGTAGTIVRLTLHRA